MCRALMQHGIEVLLLSTTADLTDSETSGAIEYKQVPSIFFPSQLGASFKYSRPLRAWLFDNVRNFDLAHIHAVFNHSSIAAAQACRRSGVPYIVRPLGTLDPWSMTQKSLRKRVFWHAAGKRMLTDAAAVHYTSEVEKLSTEGHLNLKQGRVIALGIEQNPIVQCAEFSSDPYVLVLSRLHPKKGLGVLIDAFLSLVQQEKFADWKLVLAGDGPRDYVSKLKTKAAATPHRDRVVFTGWLDDDKKHAALAGASLLALPSHQENFGLCVMEALSHSVPVLISPNVNLATEVASAKAGWIAAIDKEALEEKLSDALADKDELARRGRAGKQLSQKYSWENAARDLVSLYTAVCTQTNGTLKARAMANQARS
jgi:glycosyltransferase involved in cell wall biosynthesis